MKCAMELTFIKEEVCAKQFEEYCEKAFTNAIEFCETRVNDTLEKCANEGKNILFRHEFNFWVKNGKIFMNPVVYRLAQKHHHYYYAISQDYIIDFEIFKDYLIDHCYEVVVEGDTNFPSYDCYKWLRVIPKPKCIE